MNRVAYPRLVEAIQTQSLICVQDALAELRALEEAQYTYPAGLNPSTNELNWELTNARSDDDLTPIATLVHLYAMKQTKGDTASCERLDAIAAWLVEQGADPFQSQARRCHSHRYMDGSGRTLVEVFSHSQLPPAVRAKIETVDLRNYHDRRASQHHDQPPPSEKARTEDEGEFDEADRLAWELEAV